MREVEEDFNELKRLLRQDWEQLKRDVPDLPNISLDQVLEDHPERRILAPRQLAQTLKP